MAMHLVINPPRGAGYFPRLAAVVRRLLSIRLMARLVGSETVTLEGRVCILRAVPLNTARDMVPALIRCARSFSTWDINEALYDDFITVLSLGLRLRRSAVEKLTIPLLGLVPVIERIGQINGLLATEAGRSDSGKPLATLMNSTGTGSSRGSSAAPAGPGSTSSNA